jgi:SOS-response transcriptional repressor LexA
MGYESIYAKLRKESGRTQSEVADYVSEHSGRRCTHKIVSHWEKGVSEPSVEQFLTLCEFYGVKDVLGTFRGSEARFRGLSKLTALGRSRVEEYIAMLAGNPLFSESEEVGYEELPPRVIRLYDIPVAAGYGSFLDSEGYEDFETDETVPEDADFAVRVSGDSMTPRFVNGQIIFVKEQETLEIGEIGIFGHNGDAYVKKLGRGELVSLNPRYGPILIGEYDSFYIFGKVVG